MGSIFNNIDKFVTIEAWAKTDSISNLPGSDLYLITGKCAAGSYWVFGFYAGENSNGVDADASTTFYESGGPTAGSAGGGSIGSIKAGRWYHVLATRDDRTFKVYIDGVEKDSTTSNPNSVANTAPFQIAAKCSWYNFNGTIDDVRVYDRALEPDELYIMKQE